MSDRVGRLRGHVYRATAIVPLALVSAAWTVSMVSSSPTSPVAAALPQVALPDGTTVPSNAIDVPATVSTPDEIAPGLGLTPSNARQIVSTSTTAGIPAAALAAYQRAEAVINAADTSCKLPWQLVAAIGRVESNHGRANGNVLDNHGISRPGIYGLALDGTHGTAVVTDTDAGQYDNDTKFDRAVGPMQFIPSTWSVVGVDADGDGKRDPQDINDAALATAVYLCSGTDDLSTEAGQRASVFRYNHSQSYVTLVLSIEQQYLNGDFTSVPTSTSVAGVFTPIAIPPGSVNTSHPHPGGGQVVTADPGQGPITAGPTTGPTQIPTSTPSGGGHSGGGHPTHGPTPTHTPTHTPTPTTGPLPTHLPTHVPTLPTTGVTPVDTVLTTAQAVVQCTLEGLVDNPLVSNDKFDKCVDLLTHPQPKGGRTTPLSGSALTTPRLAATRG